MPSLQRRTLLLIFVLITFLLVLFLVSSSSSSLFSSHDENSSKSPKKYNSIDVFTFTLPPQEEKKTQSDDEQHQQHKRQLQIKSRKIVNKNNGLWIPTTCLNYFANFQSLRKIRALINWSTPLYPNEIYSPSEQEFQEIELRLLSRPEKIN